MPQLSKLIRSRKNWKSKASQRANENREYRKQAKRHRRKIAELKMQINDIKCTNKDKKNITIKT